MLNLLNIDAGYDKKQVLYDVSIRVQPGKIVGIIGPNGSGKSTILKCVSGLLQQWRGDIFYEGTLLKNPKIHKLISMGIVYSPQGNRVFDDLSIIENLEIGGYILTREERNLRLDSLFSIFPAIANRAKDPARYLSGGEKQMLALARALMTRPKLLLLDEPSLGLAPNLAENFFNTIVKLNRDNNITMLIVEQKVRHLLAIADYIFALKLGKVNYNGEVSEIDGTPGLLEKLFI